MKKVVIKILFGLVIFGLGIGGGFLFYKTQDDICTKKYSYINSSFACGKKISVEKTSMNVFREKVNEFIELQKQAGKILGVSVFFRDLNVGPTFGIDELENFSPASLLKLPLALAYLRLEEERPGTLQSVIRYTKDGAINEQTFKPLYSIKKDKNYTIEEVLFYMIAYSDNVSYSVLSEYMNSIPDGGKFVYQTYQELGFIDPTNPEQEIVTSHSYASIFRLLYNSSFLDPGLSEKMLSWLAQAEFKEGLIAGVPQSVQVAHKFGERILEEEKNGKETKQLHDCGIVYFPKNPYVLCVMTRGEKWEDLMSTIKTISSMTYEEMISRSL
jgi:beta-lactamase class A